MPMQSPRADRPSAQMVQMCKNLRDGLPDSGEVFDGAAEPVQGASKSISRNMPASQSL